MSHSQRNGLTLIEVLVVIAILAILIAFLMPATRRVREASALTQCRNNLKQLLLSMHSFQANGRPTPYRSAGDPAYPTERLFPPGCSGPGKAPEERLSWMVIDLPYLEQDSLYRQIDIAKGYAGNIRAVQTRIGIFVCPESAEAFTTDPVTHYVAMSGIGHDAAWQPAGAPGNGFMGYDRPTSLAMILDGTSNTIALMETRVHLGPWARGGASTLRGFDPADVPLYGDDRPFGGHSAGNAGMADGSVRTFHPSIDPKRLAAAITIAGGEPVNFD
jgi:prepilin-type N-terminal cleavage/methylation domain-containing protein